MLPKQKWGHLWSFGVIKLLVNVLEKWSLHSHTLIFSTGLEHSDPWIKWHI